MLYNRVFAELDKKEASKKGKPKGPVNSSHSNQKSIMDWVNGSVIEDGEIMDNDGDDDGWTEVKSKARGKCMSNSCINFELNPENIRKGVVLV